MITKTISQFRAEKGIYLKDLAEKIGVELSVLEKMDTSQNPDQEVINKIVEAYELPDTYFVEIATPITTDEPQKPKKPFKFFFGQSVIWLIILALVGVAFNIPTMIFSSIAPLLNINSGLLMNISSILIEIFSFGSAIVCVGSAMVFTNKLMQKTGYGNEIKKYDYVLYYISYKVTSVFSVATLLQAHVLSNLFENPSDDYIGMAVTGVSTSVITLIVGVISLILQSVSVAHILESTVMEDKAKAEKKIKTVGILSVVSLALYYVISLIITSITNGRFNIATAISGVVFTSSLLIVVYGFIEGKKTNEKWWLKTIPLVVILANYGIPALRDIIMKIFTMF